MTSTEVPGRPVVDDAGPAEPEPAVAGPSGPAAATVWRWLPAILLGVLVVIPIVVAGIDGVGRPWFPAGDWAMIELRTMDVGTLHTPLVGPYSRYRWNHPGPLLFWLYAIPYRLSGGQSSSLLLAAAGINITALTGMLTLAWRRGGLVLVAAVALPMSIVVQQLAPTLTRNPWNAWVTVLPFGLLVVAAWAAADGDRIAPWVLGATGAFLCQSHIAFVPLVGVLTVVGTVGFWRRAGERRPLVIAAVVTGVLWVPVLLELITGGGNVPAMVRHFVSGDSQPVGLGRAFEVVTLQLGGKGPWYGWEEKAKPAGGGLEAGDPGALWVSLIGLAVAVVAAALVHGWVRRRAARSSATDDGARTGPAGATGRLRGALRLDLVVGLTALVGWFAVSRITEEIFDYLVRWWWPLAALWWTAIGWSLVSAAGALVPRRWLRPLVAIGVSVVMVMVWGNVRAPRVTAERAPLPADDWFETMGHVAEPVVAGVPRDRPVLLRSTGPLAAWLEDAVAVQLARAGVDVRVDDTNVNRYKFGQHRLTSPDDARAAVWIATGPRVDDLRAQGRGREIAHWDPLDPSLRRAVTEVETRVEGQLRAAGRDDLARHFETGESLWFAKEVPGVDPKDIERIDAARDRGYPVVIFVFDEGNVPAPPESAR